MSTIPETRRVIPPISTNTSELAHASIGQWGPVIAAVLAGFATTVLLATLGAAIGITAGSALAPDAAANEAVAGFGIGMAIWLVLTAIVVGLVAGSVLARTSRPDRPYHAATLGLVTWAGGITLAILLAASGAMGLMGSLGGAAAATAAKPFAVSTSEVPATAGDSTVRATPDAAFRSAPLTDAERQQRAVIAERAARAVATAAWLALIGQLICLAATIGAAKWQRRRALTAAAVIPNAI